MHQVLTDESSEFLNKKRVTRQQPLIWYFIFAVFSAESGKIEVGLKLLILFKYGSRHFHSVPTEYDFMKAIMLSIISWSLLCCQLYQVKVWVRKNGSRLCSFGNKNRFKNSNSASRGLHTNYYTSGRGECFQKQLKSSNNITSKTHRSKTHHNFISRWFGHSNNNMHWSWVIQQFIGITIIKWYEKP